MLIKIIPHPASHTLSYSTFMFLVVTPQPKAVTTAT